MSSSTEKINIWVPASVVALTITILGSCIWDLSKRRVWLSLGRFFPCILKEVGLASPTAVLRNQEQENLMLSEVMSPMIMSSSELPGSHENIEYADFPMSGPTSHEIDMTGQVENSSRVNIVSPIPMSHVETGTTNELLVDISTLGFHEGGPSSLPEVVDNSMHTYDYHSSRFPPGPIPSPLPDSFQNHPASNPSPDALGFVATIYFTRAKDMAAEPFRSAKRTMQRLARKQMNQWKSSIVLQASLPIGQQALAEIVKVVKGCMEVDNRCTLQLGSWAILYYKDGEVLLHKLQKGDVPVNVEARWHEEKTGITICGLYLNGAQVKVATEHTSSTLRSAGPMTQEPGQLERLRLATEGLTFEEESLIHAAKLVEVNGCSLIVRSEASRILPPRKKLPLMVFSEALMDRIHLFSLWASSKNIIKSVLQLTEFHSGTPDSRKITAESSTGSELLAMKCEVDNKHHELVANWRSTVRMEMLDERHNVLNYLEHFSTPTNQEWYTISENVRAPMLRPLMDQMYWQRGLKDMNEVILWNVNRHQYGIIFRVRGGIKYFMGDLRGSLYDLDRAVELNRKDFATLQERALVKCMLAKFFEALSDFDTAMALKATRDFDQIHVCLRQILIRNPLPVVDSHCQESFHPVAQQSHQCSPVQTIPDLLTGDEWNPGQSTHGHVKERPEGSEDLLSGTASEYLEKPLVFAAQVDVITCECLLTANTERSEEGNVCRCLGSATCKWPFLGMIDAHFAHGTPILKRKKVTNRDVAAEVQISLDALDYCMVHEQGSSLTIASNQGTGEKGLLDVYPRASQGLDKAIDNLGQIQGPSSSLNAEGSATDQLRCLPLLHELVSNKPQTLEDLMFGVQTSADASPQFDREAKVPALPPYQYKGAHTMGVTVTGIPPAPMRRPPSKGSPKHYGVRYRPDLRKWVAEIRIAEWKSVDKKLWLGTFDTEESAARAVDAARKLVGCVKNRRFNFPCERLTADSEQIPAHLDLTDLKSEAMFKSVTSLVKRKSQDYAQEFVPGRYKSIPLNTDEMPPAKEEFQSLLPRLPLLDGNTPKECCSIQGETTSHGHEGTAGGDARSMLKAYLIDPVDKKFNVLPLCQSAKESTTWSDSLSSHKKQCENSVAQNIRSERNPGLHKVADVVTPQPPPGKGARKRRNMNSETRDSTMTVCAGQGICSRGESCPNLLQHMKPADSFPLPPALWADLKEMIILISGGVPNKDTKQWVFKWVHRPGFPFKDFPPCWVQSGQRCLVKNFPHIEKRCLKSDAVLLARLQHPNVVKLMGYAFEADESSGMLIMDHMDWDLRTLIIEQQRRMSAYQVDNPPFTLGIAVDIILQISEGMAYLHELGIHCDIRTENILVSCEDCCTDHSQRHVKILPWPTHKEVMRMRRHNIKSPDPLAADVYSFGMTAFEILTGKPHCKQREGRTRGADLAPQLTGPMLSWDSDYGPNMYLEDLLASCWATDPKRRPSFSEIHTSLGELRARLVKDKVNLSIPVI